MRSIYLLAFWLLLAALQIVADQTEPAPVAPVADPNLFVGAADPNTQDWVPQESFVSEPDEGTGPEPGNFGSSTGSGSRCPSGYGSCSNDPGKCCRLGGWCCGGSKCCNSGSWCYSGLCCLNAYNGCDGKGCCPKGYQCCKGGQCCKPGYHCYKVLGVMKCIK